MPQEIGEIYKSLVPSLSDGASIEEAFQMYHYGTATYNGNNLQPQSMERHIIDLNEDVARIDQTIASLANVYIEETSSTARPNAIVSQEPAVIPLTIRGVFGQSVPLQKWQRNTGTVNADVAQINNIGAAAFGGYLSVGDPAISTSVGLSVSLSGDHKGLTIKGVADQTDNLQEWQDNLGSIMSKVDSSGHITAPEVNVVNLNSSGLAIFNDAEIDGTLDIVGNLTTTADISTTSISLTSTATSITAAGSASISGDVGVSGTTNTKNISADGTITATGKITGNGDIEALGNLIGVGLELTQNLITAGNITANGIVKATSPNEGTTGAIRIVADVNEEAYLQFVGSNDTTELGHIKSTATELTVSQNMSVEGNVNIVSPTQFNTVIGTTTASLGARQIYLSAGDADNAVGQNGDIWIKYV